MEKILLLILLILFSCGKDHDLAHNFKTNHPSLLKNKTTKKDLKRKRDNFFKIKISSSNFLNIKIPLIDEDGNRINKKLNMITEERSDGGKYFSSKIEKLFLLKNDRHEIFNRDLLSNDDEFYFSSGLWGKESFDGELNYWSHLSATQNMKTGEIYYGFSVKLENEKSIRSFSNLRFEAFFEGDLLKEKPYSIGEFEIKERISLKSFNRNLKIKLKKISNNKIFNALQKNRGLLFKVIDYKIVEKKGDTYYFRDSLRKMNAENSKIIISGLGKVQTYYYPPKFNLENILTQIDQKFEGIKKNDGFYYSTKLGEEWGIFMNTRNNRPSQNLLKNKIQKGEVYIVKLLNTFRKTYE